MANIGRYGWFSWRPLWAPHSDTLIAGWYREDMPSGFRAASGGTRTVSWDDRTREAQTRTTHLFKKRFFALHNLAHDGSRPLSGYKRRVSAFSRLEAVADLRARGFGRGRAPVECVGAIGNVQGAPGLEGRHSGRQIHGAIQRRHRGRNRETAVGGPKALLGSRANGRGPRSSPVINALASELRLGNVGGR